MRWALGVLLAAGGAGVLFQSTFRASGTGAVDRTAMAKMRDQVSVLDYGAKGDGTTDDTAAIQAAIALAPQRVYFPCGTYKITGLTVPAGVILSLEGATRECVTLTYTGSGYAVTVGTAAADTTTVGIEKMSINVSGGTGAGCISFVRTEGGFLRDLYCQGATSGTDSGTGYNLVGTGNYVGNMVVDRVRANGNFAVGFDNNGAAGINTCNHIDYRQVSIARTTAKPGTGTIGFRWGVNCGDGALLIPDVEAYDVGYQIDGRFLYGDVRAENNTTAVVFGASSVSNRIRVQPFTNTALTTALAGTFNSIYDGQSVMSTVGNGAGTGDFLIQDHNDQNVSLRVGGGNTLEKDVSYQWLNKAGTAQWKLHKSSLNALILDDSAGNTRMILTGPTNDNWDLRGTGNGAINLNKTGGTGGVCFGTGGGACVGTVDSAGNALFSGAKTKGAITLSTGSGTATVASGSVCSCTDTTANASVKCAVSATTLTATGTGSDVIAYLCF